MSKLKDIKELVKRSYGRIANKGSSCCPSSTCCGSADAQKIARSIGYSDKEVESVPDGANLGLGCGNPLAIASLKEGDVVLDLGSGAGFDAFLAANKVGKKGRVIGVDMTPEMIERARLNAKKGGFENVEFRLGDIEKLPVEDNLIDVVISNCVINLSPDKGTVFKEAFRVLKQNGMLMVSDLVLTKEIPDRIKNSAEAYVGCIAGAVMKDVYLAYVKEAGFRKVDVIEETPYPNDAMEYVVGVKVQAIKK